MCIYIDLIIIIWVNTTCQLGQLKCTDIEYNTEAITFRLSGLTLQIYEN